MCVYLPYSRTIYYECVENLSQTSIRRLGFGKIVTENKLVSALFTEYSAQHWANRAISNSYDLAGTASYLQHVGTQSL